VKDDSKKPASSAEEQTLLELVRTTELLSQRPADLIKGEDLSRTQYNVLRILRGSPGGLSCADIAGRMITKDPDITRLLDRLEKRLLISRSREPQDRRTVVTRITSTGLEMLARLDEPLQNTLRDMLGHLGQKRLAELRKLLTACREGLA
jgi:DNA-binding MarR family transcriptional regulator